MFKYSLLSNSSTPGGSLSEKDPPPWKKHQKSLAALGGTFLVILLFGWMIRRRPSMLNGGQDMLVDIRNQTLGFEKVYVVSMPTRSDRRDSLTLAAAATGMRIEFIDGMHGEDVIDKALPPNNQEHRAGLNEGTIGAWRSHANLLQKIVRENITSALIFEEDADWDVRFKDQLTDFARSVRALTQPLAGTNATYSDPTFPIVQDPTLFPGMMRFEDLPVTEIPQHSPYGDNWDILMPGHCGVQSPVVGVPEEFKERAGLLPKGHVVQHDDPTVPEPHYIRTFDNGNFPPYTQLEKGVNHTRITHHALHFVCSHGYAISQRGARRLLNHVGIRALDGPFDRMMEIYCQRKELRNVRGACIATQPSIVGQHRPAGSVTKDFEIESPWFQNAHGNREHGFTDNVRISAQENIGNLVYGRPLKDLHPDTADGPSP